LVVKQFAFWKSEYKGTKKDEYRAAVAEYFTWC